jgi:purine-cytosine permease-like protein
MGAYLIAPFGAILLLDYVFNHRHDRDRISELYDSRRILEWGFIAWVIGAIASLPFWQLSFSAGPVATAHPEWGDLSYFVGFVAGGLAFALLYRLPPLWRGTTDHPDPDSVRPAHLNAAAETEPTN